MGHLEHAVREGAHLHVGEGGIHVIEAEAAQREPLERALEVGLDLGGGKRQAATRKLRLTVARHHDEAAQCGVEMARLGARGHLMDCRSNGLGADVLLDGSLVETARRRGLERAAQLAGGVRL